MAELSLDNIFTAEEAEHLFDDDVQETPPDTKEDNPNEGDDKDKDKNSSVIQLNTKESDKDFSTKNEEPIKHDNITYTNNSLPKTGDSTSVIPLIMGFITSNISLIGLFLKKRK